MNRTNYMCVSQFDVEEDLVIKLPWSYFSLAADDKVKSCEYLSTILFLEILHLWYSVLEYLLFVFYFCRNCFVLLGEGGREGIEFRSLHEIMWRIIKSALCFGMMWNLHYNVSNNFHILIMFYSVMQWEKYNTYYKLNPI